MSKRKAEWSQGEQLPKELRTILDTVQKLDKQHDIILDILEDLHQGLYISQRYSDEDTTVEGVSEERSD